MTGGQGAVDGELHVRRGGVAQRAECVAMMMRFDDRNLTTVAPHLATRDDVGVGDGITLTKLSKCAL